MGAGRGSARDEQSERGGRDEPPDGWRERQLDALSAVAAVRCPRSILNVVARVALADADPGADVDPWAGVDDGKDGVKYGLNESGAAMWLIHQGP